MGPQCGTEPSIKNITILNNFEIPAQSIFRNISQCANKPLIIFVIPNPANIIPVGKGSLQIGFIALCVPDWDSMPPPKLPTDTPIALFTQPIKVGVCIAFGSKFNLIIFDRINCNLRKVIHLYKPLVRKKRLDGSLATVAMRQLDIAVFSAFEESKFFHIFGDTLPGFVAIQTRINAKTILDSSIVCEDVNHGQIMP